MDRLALIFDKPAEAWNEALPLGNGTLGVMSYGRLENETLELNLDTLWSGDGSSKLNKNGHADLGHLRKLLKDQKHQEAEDYCRKHILGDWTDSYLPAGRLNMNLQMSGQTPGGYVRQLSLNHAVETVASAGYKRELFVSMADPLLAVHFQAAPGQKLHLGISLESEIRYEKIKNCEDTVLFSGRAPSYVAPPYYDCPEPVVYEDGKGIRFTLAVRAVAPGGSIKCCDGKLLIEGEQDIIVYFTGNTDFGRNADAPQLEKECMEVLEDPDKMDALIARQAELQDKIDATDAWNLDTKLERAMDALRCPPEDQPVVNLSGGERRRVALCRLLLQKPDILLLDEPTNHLDAESIDWLEQHLQQYEGTVIAVTHDRYFLDHVAGWILELDRGEGIPWKGNYSSWLEQKTKRMEMEEKTASKRRKTLERELEWVRMAPKARQAKGKARLNSYDKLLNEDVKEKEEKLEIFIPNGPRLGNKVIEAKHVAKAYGDKLLFDDLNFMLPPNGIVGVIGPNGAGKTTLFRLIMGLEKVDKGEFEVGETVKVAYVDQQHKDIDPNKTVYQVISGGNDLIRMGNRDVNARAYLSRFNFSGSDQEKLCGMLSGGERNRLHLAMALKEEGNVLLLDEPTNDIDVNTLRALEEGLEDFAGCAVVISHDRWFLDRICTHILAFEGNSEVFFFEGSYTEYEENKMKRMGNVEPKRVRYRKLMED